MKHAKYYRGTKDLSGTKRSATREWNWYGSESRFSDILKRLVAILGVVVLVGALSLAVLTMLSEPANGQDIECGFEIDPIDLEADILPVIQEEEFVPQITEDSIVEVEEVQYEDWATDDAGYGYSEYSGSYGMYYADYSASYNANGPSRTMPGWYDGYLETYYNASRHYLASTWTLDSEGFYHDADGRYVIGVDVSHQAEMPYGTVVQTGKGEAVVYDYGSGAEVHDFATNW